MIRQLAATFALVCLIGATSTAGAVEVTLPTTLDALVDDPNDPNDDATAFFVSPSGRYRFSDFVFSPVAVGTTPPGDTTILVTVSESGDSVDVSFEFQANGTATGPGAYELALEYLAEVVDPSLAFISHTLAMEGTTQGNGSIFINEEILAPGGGGIGTVTTTANVPNRPNTFSDTFQFSPMRTMTIHNKDISVSGGSGSTDSATLTRIEQSFQVIPEPSSAILLALGLLGLGVASRRFQPHQPESPHRPGLRHPAE
jgi:hypothetical protein